MGPGIRPGGEGGTTPALACVVNAGARPAEPGEFTRRAFLNGKIDLLQAEAVADLISARSDRASVAAYEQLQGQLSRRLNAIYDGVLQVAAELEATLDFPEEEVPEPVMDRIRSRLARCLSEIQALIDTWQEGHALREGARVVISGRPNVGKSTLLNLLLGRDRAIVSDKPGTTRDTLEEGCVIHGIPIRLIDTAGLRETECDIEQEGIRRAKKTLQISDIQIFMIDNSKCLEPTDQKLIEDLNPQRSLIVLNKSDLGRCVDTHRLGGLPVIESALIGGEGLGRIRAALDSRLTDNLGLTAEPHAMISSRHYSLLQKAGELAAEALDNLPDGDETEEVIAASTLRLALESLGRVTGRVYEEELLDSIFSQFCIGK